MDNTKHIRYCIDGINYELGIDSKTVSNDRGGNGLIYFNNNHAIKVLIKIDQEDRYKRMVNEITEAKKIFAENNNAIIPVLAENYASFEEQKEGINFLFFVMPKCEPLKHVPKTIYEYLQIMIESAESLISIHKCGYAHRDVKKSNILKFSGKWRMSDYGCIFPYSLEDRISSDGEKVGPYGAPQELMKIDTEIPDKEYEINLYKKSDSFLFAKMMWHIIMEKGQVFEKSLIEHDINYWMYFNKFRELYPDYPVTPLLDIMTQTILWKTEDYDKRLSIQQILSKLNEYKILIINGYSEKHNELLTKENVMFFQRTNIPTSEIYEGQDLITKIDMIFPKSGSLFVEDNGKEQELYRYLRKNIFNGTFVLTSSESKISFIPRKIEIEHNEDNRQTNIVKIYLVDSKYKIIFNNDIENDNTCQYFYLKA